jgi:hypothetical protein
LIVIRGILALTTAGLLFGAAPASALDPQSFAEVSSGIVLVQAANCRDGGISRGSGFLVGTSVVMTASHVVQGCRSVRVLVKEKRWVPVTSSINWSDRGGRLDVSTLKLAQTLSDVWLFSLRPSQIPTKAYVAALGHPLGEGVSYTNGRVLGRIARQQIVMRILGAQGMSGGPVVDSYGRVVGVVNGLFSKAVGLATGAYTADNLVAYDLSSSWGVWRRTLCQTHRFGGIEGCPNSTAASPPSVSAPSPPATPPAPPSPPPSPPPPVWSPPAGFTLWTGLGSYKAGTVAVQYASSACTPTYSTSQGCWGINVIAQYGCRDGLFVNVAIYDSNNTIVDSGIDEIPILLPNQIALAHGDTFQPTAVKVSITRVDCYDY